MKIIKTRIVKIPKISDKYSAGYDFFIPELNSITIEDIKKLNNDKDIVHFFSIDSKYIRILPKEQVEIPTGIKVKMKKYKILNFIFKLFNIQITPKLQAYDKSSKGKIGLTCLAGLIDWSYRGEIIVILYNMSNNEIRLFENEKFIQFVQEFALITKPKIISPKKYSKFKTNRGFGGFGSTGLK
jgi:dUTPase